MSGRTKDWTTQELELYYDGELDTDQRTELSDSLRRDPELRERFASVCRVDDGLRAAFLVEGTVEHYGPRTGVRFSIPASAAACVLIAMGLTWWFGFGDEPSRETSLAQLPTPASATEESEYRSIRVVLSLPVKTDSDPRLDDHEVQAAAVTGRHAGPAGSSVNVQAFLAQLDGTLAAGRVQNTLDLLDVATKDQRTVAYLRMGELLRSAHFAEQILGRLSPQDQLTVCALWAREPVAQPTVFERLRRFSKQTDLSEDVRAIVAVLSRDPELRPWLQGYQLLGYGATAPTGSS